MSAPRTSLAVLADPVAEREYLAHIVLDAGETLDRAPVAPEAFAGLSRRRMLEAMRAVRDRGDELDTVGVRAELIRRGQVDLEEELLALTNTVPVNQPHRLRERLESLHRDRRLQDALLAALKGVHDGESDEAIRALEDQLDALRKREVERYSTTGEAAEEAYEASAKLRNEGRSATIPTGIPAVDEDAGGLEHGDLMVIGGDTSVGKSSVALMMAMHQAARGEVPGIISCEDPRSRWGRRVLAITSNVPVQVIQRAAWSDAQGETMRFAIGRVKANPVHLAYAIGERLDVVLEAARYLLREKGCTVIFLDYVSACEVPGVDDPTEQVRTVATGFKRELNRKGVRAAGVALSQFRKREDEHLAPERKHLYFGQRLAQAAELILLLWKDKDRTLHGILDKSKDSGTGTEFTLERDRASGMLVDPERREDRGW